MKLLGLTCGQSPRPGETEPASRGRWCWPKGQASSGPATGRAPPGPSGGGRTRAPGTPSPTDTAESPEDRGTRIDGRNRVTDSGQGDECYLIQNSDKERDFCFFLRDNALESTFMQHRSPCALLFFSFIHLLPLSMVMGRGHRSQLSAGKQLCVFHKFADNGVFILHSFF